MLSYRLRIKLMKICISVTIEPSKNTWLLLLRTKYSQKKPVGRLYTMAMLYPSTMSSYTLSALKIHPLLVKKVSRYVQTIK